MKNLICIFCFYLVSQSLLFSQNLIPNGDFEAGPNGTSEAWTLKHDITCSSLDLLSGPNEWFILEGTPDRLFNGDIHCNWDNAIAQSGNAYVCLGYLEAGKATLSQPLKSDSTYKISGYFILNTFSGLSNEPNRFYIKFTNTNDSIIFPFVNQNINWIYFDTIFVANEDVNEIEIWSNEYVQSGVYIDNLVLEKIETNSLIEDGNVKINIYPNPSNGKVKISNLPHNFFKVIIYNSLNQKIMEINENHIFNNNFELEDLKDGVYYLQILSGTKINNFKILVTNY